jgi:hypothetical protein
MSSTTFASSFDVTQDVAVVQEFRVLIVTIKDHRHSRSQSLLQSESIQVHVATGKIMPDGAQRPKRFRRCVFQPSRFSHNLVAVEYLIPTVDVCKIDRLIHWTQIMELGTSYCSSLLYKLQRFN